MHRRGFLTALAGAGTFAAFPRSLQFPGHAVARGYKPDGRGDLPFSSLEIRIGRHVTGRVAENARKRILMAPAHEVLGEFYPSNPVEQDVPERLDGIGQVVHYDVVAGVAAQKSTLLMGAFRIGPLMWMIDGRNAQLDLVTELAAQVAGAIDEQGTDRFRTSASLKLLLPEPSDFPVDAKLADLDEFMFRFGL